MSSVCTPRIAILVRDQRPLLYDVVRGVSQYVHASRMAWDLFFDLAINKPLERLRDWGCDGVIAEVSDQDMAHAITQFSVPVVGVGWWKDTTDMLPPNIPCVISDNAHLIRTAYAHLRSRGLVNIAMLSLPEQRFNPWICEREAAYRALSDEHQLPANIFVGADACAPTWSDSGQQLTEWLRGLPRPSGIIAVTDERARQLIQACVTADILVPGHVAVVGIDNDPLLRTMTRIPLTSVIQGTREMGSTAARLLHQRLMGVPVPCSPVLVAPEGIDVQASSLYEANTHSYILRARHYIRQYACQGIKTEQVAAYVGVSRSSLDAYFRTETGQSVHDEILQFKLSVAKDMLAQSSASMADIVAASGFTSVQYLLTVFKRELNCTPGQYRVRQQAPDAKANTPGVAW